MKVYEKLLLNDNDTAFYLFDAAELKRRIFRLRSMLPEETALCFAVKANPFLVRELTDCVDRFEICSPGEAMICRSLNVPKNRMVISGVYKTPTQVRGLLSDPYFNGVITVESVRQYRLIGEFAQRFKRRAVVLLRLTNKSQFGLNKTEIEQIISQRGRNPRISVAGLQFFSGTQKTSIKKIRRELEELDLFLLRLKEVFGYEATELEYGPGFPVPYFDGDPFDEGEYLREFSALLSGMHNKPKLTLELGRSIAASCGRYYTHIVDIKQNDGQDYLITDGGMHQLVYYGQQMAMKQPAVRVVGKENAEPEASWNICGALCSMNDILAKQIMLPAVQVGDVLCFENTGAYCMTEGISLFLSRELPAVWMRPEYGAPFPIRMPVETYLYNTPSYERMRSDD